MGVQSFVLKLGQMGTVKVDTLQHEMLVRSQEKVGTPIARIFIFLQAPGCQEILEKSKKQI
jgi:hypothetical protein